MQGVYREGAPAGGLPLPRKALGVLTAIVILLGVLAIGAPSVLLGVVERGRAGAWRLFVDGGTSMWPLVLLGVVVPIAVAGLGVFVMRGKRVPPGLLFVAASLPFGVALLGAWQGHRRVIGAVGGEAVDPEQKARLLAEGIAETMSNDVLGGLVACGASLVAAVACAATVASIDIRIAERQSVRAGGLLAGAVAAGAWLVATLALSALRLRAAGPLVLLPVLVVAALVPFATLAARATPILRAWHDRAEARHAASSLLVAMAASLLALFALERAIDAAATSRALSAIAGESLDDSQRARILAESLVAVKLAPASYAVHAVLGVATFGVLLARAGNPISPSSAAALLLGGALLFAAHRLGDLRAAAPRALATGSVGPLDVTLPVAPAALSPGDPRDVRRWRVVVKKDGSGTGPASPACREIGPWQEVFADRDATLAMLRAHVGPPRTGCTYELLFVLERPHPRDVDAALGDLAGYVGRTARVPLRLDDGVPAEDAPEMRVRVEDDAVEVDGTRLPLPLRPSAAAGPRVRRIRYAFRKTDTMARVFDTIAAVESAFADRVERSEIDRVLDDGEHPLPRPSIDLGGLGSSPIPGASGRKARSP